MFVPVLWFAKTGERVFLISAGKGKHMPTVYGYIRVSTRAQRDERQWLALRQAGVAEQNIFVDRATGGHFNRPAYRRLLGRLRPGDLIVVQSIDRLGRNYEEMLRQWRLLVEEKQADVRILDMPLLDTRRRKNAAAALMADMMLRLLSYMAQAEREAIRGRQAQGIAAAKARGVRFGRPRLPVPDGFETLKAQWKEGKISSRQAAQRLCISHQTFLRWAKEK